LTRHAETAVLAIDLDQFKSINDRFGHAVGDRVLQLFAQTARAAVAAPGLVGRLGGEEFAAVLCHAKANEAIGLAEQMRRAFAEAASQVDGHRVRATVSIGIVLNRDATLGLYDLLVQADQALYRAKTRGRNCIELANAVPLAVVPAEQAA
jgi:diguanylate cyclase (GGDEF)-like protein